MDWEAREASAKAFAEERHGSQRYGEHPYAVHLAAVRQVLADFGYGEALAVAAWLHDVVEDTPTERAEIARRFGPEVAELVWAVTGVGADRGERNASAYAKIRSCPRAAILKLADRIANVEAGCNAGGCAAPDAARKLDRYRDEWGGFADALAGLGDPRMWARLKRAINRGA